MIITIYKSVYNSTPIHIHVDKVLSRFRSEDKDNIGKLSELSKEQRDQAKKDLPIACFGGKFKARKSDELIESSGLLTLDFDDVDIQKVKEHLQKDENIYSYWVSPSGKGLKALVLIDKVNNDAEYKAYYNYIYENRYKGLLDSSGKDINRACFFCYDPELVINDNVKPLKIEIEKPKKIKANIDRIANDYSVVNVPCDMIRYAQVGERHNKIRDAARLLGGYVANDYISREEAERILRVEADRINDDYKDNEKAIEDGLNDGISNPLTPKKLEQESKEKKSLIKYGKIYYTLKDKEEELNDYFENGNTRGYLSGHKELDNHYSLKMGATTYVYGAPFAGKTQFWFELLICYSVKNGLRHAIFSPETGDAKEIFAELVSMVAKADFTKTFKNQMSKETRDEAYKFVDKHFVVIDPSDNIITHKDFFNYLNEIERVYNTKIHTATIDPFNEFRQDLSGYSNRQDLYLESVLTEVRQNAKLNDRHNCIITHVQDQQLQKSGNVMYYPQPTYREIAGGQAWSRKGMSMISIWRPKEGLMDENGMPYASNETLAHIQKSKPKGTGEVGIVRMLYEAKKHRYTDLNGKYANEKEEQKVEQRYNSSYESFDVAKAYDAIDEFNRSVDDAPF